MTRIQRMFSTVLVASLAMFVTACGFHLRGTVDIASDLESLSIQSPDRGFQKLLATSLEQTGIQVKSEAPYKITILDLNSKEQIASTSGGNIVTDYDVIATLKWQLENADGLKLTQPIEMQQFATYQRYEDQYNASQRELETIWKDLQRTLATSLTRQIAAMSNSQLEELTVKAREALKAAEQNAQNQPQGLLTP
ncbi:hypothetical protein M3P05_04275 [Sansalvadorimonas sp. 2012CJ34-2]|uniref:LPS-assembly lipoprotein LptE n=1 Tax=Parendozoicomonas callyspongiae TaxID=2942213 RepID=A0ABT0PCT2_9GAMM|nr:LPS assembly lipoprotein LptE [Sansalvadorimonas sp. 2012CJ34-2]MCL6269159.1 hypothetical protein [Sansalvadorimonas sp. 2012CJ34-2]